MLTGGCFCGRVRYAAQGTPYNSTLCHCTDCRRAAGAPSVGWYTVRTGDYRVTAGQPATWRSSPGVARSFCAACGTQLTYQHDDRAHEIDVTTCSLDDPTAVPPRDHTYAGECLPWVALGDLPVREGS